MMADPDGRLPQGEINDDELPYERQRPAKRDFEHLARPSMTAELKSPKCKGSSMRARPAVKTSKTIPPSSEAMTERPLTSAFSSPMRPKSTPFPQTPSEPTSATESTDDSRWSRHPKLTDEVPVSSLSLSPPAQDDRPSVTSRLIELPTEIQEAILDYVFGFYSSTTSQSGQYIPSMGSNSWTVAKRYGRRKNLTALATVNRQWKCLVQSRLFRHIKLRGTIAELNDAIKFLSVRDELRGYVQHLEIWFPVFYHKASVTTVDTMARGMASHMAANYLLPGDKCSLEDVFRFIALTLPSVRCLTLEGGERRKAPKIDVFNKRLGLTELTRLETVTTLVMKGQWNLARDNGDFANIITAIPNLRRLYSSYSRGKSKSYITIANYLPLLHQQAQNINDLRLCLESDGRREALAPTYARKAAARVHICESLAQAASNLEHFSYSGRLCHSLFDRLGKLSDSRSTRLRTMDITLKNCCRTVDQITEGTGSGLEVMGFMKAFEKLVLGAIRALSTLTEIRYLRIRFVDLESTVPVLNPFFLYHNGQCSGVWSSTIVNEMSRVRPDATWVELLHSFGEAQYEYRPDGRLVVHQIAPNSTPLVSQPLSAYQLFWTQYGGTYPPHPFLGGQ